MRGVLRRARTAVVGRVIGHAKTSKLETHNALAVVARRTRGTDVLELKRVAACYECQRLTTNRSINASDLDACDADSCETLVRLYLGTGTEVWAFYYSSTTRSVQTPEPFPRARTP